MKYQTPLSASHLLEDQNRCFFARGGGVTARFPFLWLEIERGLGGVATTGDSPAVGAGGNAATPATSVPVLIPGTGVARLQRRWVSAGGLLITRLINN